jgi:two-component system, cell cycle response regulator DivK
VSHFSALPPRSQPLVLLVDDFVDAREMYAEYLTFAGFAVTTAGDGGEALRSARACRPDVILMDMTMPVIDGWEATRRLKADLELKRIPVIALSAHTLHEDVARMRRVGCDAVLSKPCLPDVLCAAIRGILKSVDR